MIARRKSLFLIGAMLALGACGQRPELRVADGWVRLPAVAGNPGAAYFTIHGGETADRLIGVTSPVAIRTEMHQTVETGGVSTMAPLDGVDIPVKGKIDFAPGGRHVMLFNINPGIVPGKTVRMIFTFNSGERIIYDAPARAAGDTGR